MSKSKCYQLEDTFFFACPNSVALHLAANPRELIDSPAFTAAGLTFTNIKHLESPAHHTYSSSQSWPLHPVLIAKGLLST